MAKLILVTVGTSVLFGKNSGWKDSKYYPDEKKLAAKLEVNINERIQDNEDSDYSDHRKRVIKKLKHNLNLYYKNGEKGYEKLSAELASLLAMSKAIDRITDKDKIALLHSDTAAGQLCAEVNAQLICSGIMNCPSPSIEILEKDESGRQIVTAFKSPDNMKEIIRMIRIVGLQHRNPQDFVKKGLVNLHERSKKLLESHLDWEKYINITGGYKGEVPIQTLLAALKRVPIVYLFENAELVTMNIDENRIEVHAGNLSTSVSNTRSNRRNVETRHVFC